MEIRLSGISCGIGLLENVCARGRKKTLPDNWNEYGMILASLTTKQKADAKFLIGLGFRKVGRKQYNPNSGNEILLFRKDVAKKDQNEW